MDASLERLKAKIAKLKTQQQEKERHLYRQGLTQMSLRRAQVRTKIQLGGLIQKAGLLESLGIHPGDGLQKDEQIFDGVATLMGAFCDLTHPLQTDEAQKLLWKERGKKVLANS